MPPLLRVEDVAAALSAGTAVRLLDVRWRLDIPEGRPAYVAAHLPGAVYVDLETELAAGGNPAIGRYPLPDAAGLSESARRWGIHPGDLVVAYDDNDGVAAARLWWLLRRRGVDVGVLDGGLRAWVAAGHPIERGDVAPRRGSGELPDADPGTVTIEEAARAPAEGQLVDVRGPDHYRGLTAGAEPAAGHIPGAVNVPTSLHIAADGRMVAPDLIRATFARAGVDLARPIVLYCSVGIASAHSALALAHAGVEARVFPGSWSQWAHAAGRPVAVGPTPSDRFSGW
ncbi:sulfurtransferase [Microbacterium sp. RD1]|uniref:sulfurtransferase n=1 Tax=Microbacterium sp. RD1 TaxID=3457313 RepID=UPI003FA53872